MIKISANIIFPMALSLLVLLPVGVYSQDTDSSSTPAFDDFRIIVDRNIFDPERVSRPSTIYIPRERPPEIDRLNLRGVLVHNGGSVAFFDGSKSEYNRILKPGETIAGFKITVINTDKLILASDGRQIELPVGSGLKREEGNSWEVTSTQGYQEPATPVSTASGTESVSSGNGDDNMSDIMRKMMERRQKETGQ